VIRTGRSVRYDAVPELVRERAAPPDATPELAGLLKPSTGMGIPLRVRDRVIGSIALARIDGPAYTPDDQVLVEQIADRAAVAVDNAQRFWRERDTALALQRSLLPQELPSVPGLHVAWRYLPGTAGTYVGGDWYDVIPLDDGQVALVIGDVMGHGVQAAAVMGQLRATARAYAAADLRPGQVLALLDRAVARLEQGQITTVAFAVLDPRTRRLVIASAGHLPPLLVDGTDHPQYLDLDPGPPLGAGGTDFPERALTLPEGAMLLLFTDGLVEDRSRPVDEGLTRLQEAVAGPGADPEQLCEQALAVLGPDRGHEDDTALLAVSLDPAHAIR
jgi:serine phosphatase RsbU (regulator of sigma subunit)